MPVILREPFADSSQFNEIHRGITLISRPLLARRLRELKAAGVLARELLANGRGHRYLLTDAGKEFLPVIAGLGAWGQRRTVRSRGTTSMRTFGCGICAGAWLRISCRRSACALRVQRHTRDVPRTSALRAGEIRLVGRRELVKALPS